MAATGRRRPAATLLIALMALGSILLWLGIPLGWIYLASKLVRTSDPSMGPYLLVVVAIPVSMGIVVKGLTRLNQAYGELMHTARGGPVRLPWHRSLRGERDTHQPRTILDVVMVCSVALALVCLVVWFFAFAGSSLPR